MGVWPDERHHLLPVDARIYRRIQDDLRGISGRGTAEDIERIAGLMDELAVSAADPGPESLVIDVEQIKRMAEGLRTRNSFSPPQLAAAIESYVREESR